jgi:hypothetical protein
VGAPGTSSSCVNGTQVTLASSTTGFPISADNVNFDGPQSQSSGSAAPSGTSAPSGSSSPSGAGSPSPSASQKSGSGIVQVGVVSLFGALGVGFMLL